MATETLICDWKECSIVARFHIVVQLLTKLRLKGEKAPHHNLCAGHLDEYAATRQPSAIYTLRNCPDCSPA